jgi:nucleotide-binding universal stress UspA family protein
LHFVQASSEERPPEVAGSLAGHILADQQAVTRRALGSGIAFAVMNATAPPDGNLYFVVGYDGSPPAVRALDAAIRLLQDRTGSIEVVYVAHLPSVDSLSPGAVAEMETSFDEIAQELHTAATEQLRDREERWRFERREGPIAEELIAAATDIRDAHPGDTVVIAVGSSSHAMHRVVGSVAVSLARRSAVPLVVVP